MAQHAIEMILSKHLAANIAIPVFLVSPNGALAFYNEPAESLLGRRFNETGPMPASEWASLFQPTNEQGQPIPAQKLPLVIAFTHKRPASSTMWISGLDGARRALQVTAVPLMRTPTECVGALALFWERTDS